MASNEVTSMAPLARARVRATASPRPSPGRVQRLESLRHSRRPPFKASEAARSIAPKCTNASCTRSDVGDDDGKLVCRNCGFVLQDMQITQEVTFGETSSGAAVVQGVFLGANDENARNSALGNSKLAGGMDSRQITERNGVAAIASLAAALNLSQTHKDRAMRVYRLAMNINFIQGRQTRHVAAVCLYVACRRDQESRIMLIDFSEVLSINVFKLGQVYNTLVQELGLRTDGVGIYDVNPENLLHRFAQDLEFGEDTTRIANEAVQILKRLKRDWIATGRRPAGVCGAAIILAARMNNYRRTVREVVYVAKVADITIHKRLDEFKFTEASRLTVSEFRHHGLSLENEHDPPAFYEQFTKKKPRRKRMLTGTAEDEMSDADSQREASAAATMGDAVMSGALPTPQATQRAHADSEAMPPPPVPVPVDPALVDANAPRPSVTSAATSKTTRRKRVGRPEGTKNKPLPTKTKKVALEEVQMESDIDAMLRDPEILADATETHAAVALVTPATLSSTPSAAAAAATIDLTAAGETALESVEDEGQASPPTNRPASNHAAGSDERAIPDSEIIPEDEFDDDPEVGNCLLSPTEVEIKEKIWVQMNGDYLRTQQARMIKQQLAEANGTARVIIRRKRKRGRMGDMSRYQKIGPDGKVTGPQTAAEATKAMLAQRGYSKKINYARVDYLFDRSASSRSASTSQRATSEVESRSATPHTHVGPYATARASISEDEEEGDGKEDAGEGDEAEDEEGDEDGEDEDDERAALPRPPLSLAKKRNASRPSLPAAKNQAEKTAIASAVLGEDAMLQDLAAAEQGSQGDDYDEEDDAESNYDDANATEGLYEMEEGFESAEEDYDEE